jgi:hypothetical protein
MCFSAVAPLWGWYNEVCGGGSERTHLRGGERGCLPELCCAPQYGSTSLHLAAYGGYAAVVEQLLAAGAVADTKDKVRGERGAHRGWLGGRMQLCVSS